MRYSKLLNARKMKDPCIATVTAQVPGPETAMARNSAAPIYHPRAVPTQRDFEAKSAHVLLELDDG